MKTDTKQIIDEDILTMISESALKAYGVTSMAEDAEGLKTNILNRDSVSKSGVRASHDKEGNLIVDVFIRVGYGIKIPQLAWELQRQIQSDVRDSADIILNDINIHVEGVDMGDEND